MQHPRLAADEAHVRDEVGVICEENMAVTRHVDHPVIGGDHSAGAGRERLGARALADGRERTIMGALA